MASPATMEHQLNPSEHPQHHHHQLQHHELSTFTDDELHFDSNRYAGEELQLDALRSPLPQPLYAHSMWPADDSGVEQPMPSSAFSSPLTLNVHNAAFAAAATFSSAAAESAHSGASQSSSSSSASPQASPLFFPTPPDSADRGADSSRFEASTFLIPSQPSGSVKRRRLSSLTPQQREAVNRQKHKEIDAQRRRREAAIVKQLDQLIDEKDEDEVEEAAAGGCTDVESSSSSTSSRSSSGKADSACEEKRDKVTILERSAEELQRLRFLYRKLRRVCNTKDRRIQQLVHHLRAVSASSSSPLLPPATASYLAFLDNDHTVHSSLFVRSPLSLLLLTSGLLIDVNARFLSVTGWQRDDIVNLRCSPPYTTVSANLISPIMRKHLLHPVTGEVLTTRFCVQYPSAKKEVSKVLNGQLKKVEAAIRMFVPSGRIIEASYSCWRDGDCMVLATVLEDGVLLDDTSINSGYDETEYDEVDGHYGKYAAAADSTDSDSSSSASTDLQRRQ